MTVNALILKAFRLRLPLMSQPLRRIHEVIKPSTLSDAVGTEASLWCPALRDGRPLRFGCAQSSLTRSESAMSRSRILAPPIVAFAGHEGNFQSMEGLLKVARFLDKP